MPHIFFEFKVGDEVDLPDGAKGIIVNCIRNEFFNEYCIRYKESTQECCFDQQTILYYNPKEKTNQKINQPKFIIGEEVLLSDTNEKGIIISIYTEVDNENSYKIKVGNGFHCVRYAHEDELLKINQLKFSLNETVISPLGISTIIAIRESIKEYWVKAGILRKWCKEEQLEKIEKPKPKQESKPPFGLMPHRLWIEKRRDNIFNAIARYKEQGKDIPIEWINEYTEIFKELCYLPK